MWWSGPLEQVTQAPSVGDAEDFMEAWFTQIGVDQKDRLFKAGPADLGQRKGQIRCDSRLAFPGVGAGDHDEARSLPVRSRIQHRCRRRLERVRQERRLLG